MDGTGARHTLRQYPGAIGGRSRRATPLTKQRAFVQPPRQKVTCPHLLGQFEIRSGVFYGGTGWTDGGDIVRTTVFERPSGSAYDVKLHDWPALTLNTAYNIEDLYSPGGIDTTVDFVEFDDDGNVYAWDAILGTLTRWVISGSDYVLDDTLQTGEIGLHLSVYNYYDGLLYYAYVGSTDPMFSVDPASGTRTDVTDGGVTWDFHERMCVNPNGDVWAHSGSSGGDHSFVVYRPGTGEIDTLLSVDSERDVFFGMYPSGDRMAVMVAPDDGGADEWNVYTVGPGASGAGLPVACTFRTDSHFEPHTIGPTHDGAAMTRDGTWFMRTGRGLTIEADRYTDTYVFVP